MKVLFLDVDGVLNVRRDYEVITDTGRGLMLNVKRVDRLKEIIKETGCKVVLSSSWRNLGGGREFVEQWADVELLDETDNGPGVRGDQIQRWLDSHPEVIRYAIVDDDGDMLLDQLPNFFQTEFEYGLTETIAYRITYHLNTDPEKDRYLT